MPLPKGAGAVRCMDCGAEARADGKGTPIVLRHEPDCPNHVKTSKQKLLNHMVDHHSATRSELARWTFERMQKWHAHLHHRYHTDHYHEGPNTGPGNRPPGWKTGEGVVWREGTKQ